MAEIKKMRFKTMRHFHLTILVAILLMTLTCSQTSKSANKEKVLIEKENDNSNSNNLDFLKKLNGKYPYQVKLFGNSAFTQRLKKLIGNSRYRFLKKTWAVEVPMEVANDIFVASGCQAHNCGSTNFIIVVDFSKNVMYAGIKEEDKIETYSEDGSYSPEMNEWVNENFYLDMLFR